jgi:hypothetical protein
MGLSIAPSTTKELHLQKQGSAVAILGVVVGAVALSF